MNTPLGLIYRSTLSRYGIALAAVAAALLARIALDPYLHDHLPFVTFFAAVAGAAWFGKTGPALVTTVAGYLAADWFFVPPRNAFGVVAQTDLAAAAAYLGGALAITYFTRALHKAREHARTRRLELEKEAAERRRAEEALRRSEEQFRAAFDSGAFGMALTGLDGVLLRVNPAFCDLLGYSEAELIGRGFGDVTHPEDRAASFAGLESLASGRDTSFRMEKRYVRKDGRVIWVDMTSASVRGSDGDPSYVVTQVADITERKAMERGLEDARAELETRVRERTADLDQTLDALRAEQRRFHDVLDMLPAYVVLLSPDYHVPFENRFFRERFGESRGRRCFEYLFGRSGPCEVCETYRALETMEPHHWEWTGPDGRAYDVHDFPFTDSAGSTLILEMGLDVTGRKRAEEMVRLQADHYTTMLAASTDGFWLLDADGKILDVNDASCRMSGYTRAELVGMPLADLEARETREDVERHLDAILQAGFDRFESRHRRKDGRIIDVEISVSFSRATGHLLTFVRDITARKRAEADLELYRNHLEDVVRERTCQLEAANARLESEIAARRAQGERLAALARTTGQVLAATTVDELLQHVVDAARELVGAGIAVCGRFEDGVFRICAGSAGDGVPNCTPGTTYAISRGGVYMDLMEHARSIRLTDDEMHAHPRWWGLPDGHPQLDGLLGARLVNASGGVSGVILLSSKQDGRFTAEDESLLVQLAGAASLALQHIEARIDAVGEKHRIEAVLETLPVGMAIVDARGGNVRSNSAFEAVWGPRPHACEVGDYTAHKAWWVDSGRPVQPEEWASARALREGTPVVGQLMEVQGFDGMRRFVVDSAAPVRDAEGKVTGCVVAIEDITAVRQMEQALRASEERLRLAQNAANLGVWDWRPQEDTASYTPEVERLYGLPNGALGNYQRWREFVHPDDLIRIEAECQQAIRNHAPFELEYRIRHGSGETRWLSSKGGAVYNEAGEPVRVLGVNTDITTRKQMEEALRLAEHRFRSLVDSNVIGIVVARAGRVLEANDHFLGMLGSAREQFTAGTIDLRAITPANHSAADESGMEQLLAGGTCVPYEKEFLRRDGTRVPVLVGGTLLERTPEPLFLLFVVDLTDRKRFEQRILEAAKLESVGLLAGGIAHDFNNLLIGVIGNGSLAQDMLPPGHPVVELLDRIVRTGEQAAHLTRQMLAYSGKGRFLLEPLDLAELVVEVGELVQPSIPKKVTLHLELDRNIPPLEADRSQMQQIVMNLVLNAAEAIGSETGLISVATRVSEVGPADGSGVQPGRYVSIEVRDTGCGMDEATKARIFDPFFTTKFTGRGLGLAAVAGIVRGHKGAIQVMSEPGKGSRFLVFLPLKESATAAPRRARLREDLRGKGTVLVVDDEEIVRDMAKRALERYGFKVLMADGGASAIHVFKREPSRISLVILDLSMPGMSGEEALPELRKIRPDVKVIVSSGYSEAEAMRLFEGQRVYGFIQKPYTAGRLVETAKSAIG